MTLEERHKECIRDDVPLNTILPWKEEVRGKSQNDEENTQEISQVVEFEWKSFSLWSDIALLEVDAVVNVANASLLGGEEADLPEENKEKLVFSCYRKRK